MIIDRDIMQEYPFDGVFYTYGIDGSKPADQQVEEEIIVLETKCDIQGAQKEDSGVISNAYNVYFPFDKSVGIAIKKVINLGARCMASLLLMLSLLILYQLN